MEIPLASSIQASAIRRVFVMAGSLSFCKNDSARTAYATLGLEMVAKQISSGVKRGYIDSQPKRKTEFPDYSELARDS